jgi:hypothetical protein
MTVSPWMSRDRAQCPQRTQTVARSIEQATSAKERERKAQKRAPMRRLLALLRELWSTLGFQIGQIDDRGNDGHILMLLTRTPCFGVTWCGRPGAGYPRISASRVNT